ncbi:MAG: glycoside hydrolase domain-containing protein [Gemmatimonadaceae bacterium]
MRKRQVPTLVAASVAAVFVPTHAGQLTDSPASIVTETIGDLPKALADLINDEKRSRPGRHAGFDTYAYPGDEIMRAWRHPEVPFEWVGYYLPAPCHDGRSWVGKRERLASMGWGIAVIYVGQQTWDKTPTGYETRYRSVRRTKYIKKRVKAYRTVNGRRVPRYVTRSVPVRRWVRVPYKVRIDPHRTSIEDCNAQLVNGTRGSMEAGDAIRRTAAEGFPIGSVIFLDIEYMQRVPQKMREYYRAWTAHVLADGRYRPGYYVHTRNAETIFNDVKTVYAQAGRVEEPPFWIAGGDDFTTDKAPHEVGHAFADMWQGLLDVRQKWNGHSLPIDVNVSEVPDPSHRYVAVE